MNKAIVFGLALLTFGQAAVAAQGDVWGARVDRTMVISDGRWGGCMARLDQPISAAGVDCPGNWVTFSCTGDFSSKDMAFRMFDTAQMAYALQTRVSVVVNDAQKHNGYCFANRIWAIQ